MPKGDEWHYEAKYDGYLAQAAIADDQVRIYSSETLEIRHDVYCLFSRALRC